MYCTMYVIQQNTKYYIIFKNTYKCTCSYVQKIKNMYTKFVIALSHKWLDMEEETSNVSIICVNDYIKTDKAVIINYKISGWWVNYYACYFLQIFLCFDFLTIITSKPRKYI